MNRATSWALAAGAGVLFALGLALGGMTRTDKVLGFLDVTGNWDPALAFVMGGAISVHAVAYVVQRRTDGPWIGGSWSLPTSRVIDRRLVGGAVLFGVGWGLSGLCPGPAVMNVATFDPGTLVFVASMVVGMVLEHVWARRAIAREGDDDGAMVVAGA